MDRFRDVTVLHADDQWCQYLIKIFNRPNCDILIHSVNVTDLPYKNPPEMEVSVRESYVIILLLTADFVEYMEANSDWFVGMLGRHNKEITTIFAAMLCVDYSDCLQVLSATNYNHAPWEFTEINDDASNIVEVVMRFIGKRDSNLDKHKQIYEAEHRIADSKGCQMFPNKVRMNQDEIAIVFADHIEGEVTLLFDGVDEPVTTTPLNPFCVTFTPPVLPSGSHTVHVLLDDVEVEVLELLYYKVDITSLDLMKQFFGVTKTKELDKLLASQYRNSMCTDETLTTLVNLAASQQDIDTKADYPTALHWSAAHGLKDLTSQLLLSPCAVDICQVENCQGETVSELAKRHGHKSLKQYIEDFIDTKQCADIYESYVHASFGNQGIEQWADADDLYVHHCPANDYVDSEEPACTQQDDFYEAMSAEPLVEQVLPPPIPKRDNEPVESYEPMIAGPLMKQVLPPPIPKRDKQPQPADEVYEDMSSNPPLPLGAILKPRTRMNSNPQTISERTAANTRDKKSNTEDVHRGVSATKPPPPQIPRRRFHSEDVRHGVSAAEQPPPPRPQKKRSQSDPALKVGAVGCRSQNELIDIMDEVKAKNFTIDDAEMLFNTWKERYQRGNVAMSFKDKQKTLNNMRCQYKGTLSALAEVTKKATAPVHQAGTFSDDPIISDPIIPRKGEVGSKHRREEERSSNASSRSSNDSVTCRTSNDSGCDVPVDNELNNATHLAEQYRKSLTFDKDKEEDVRPPLPMRRPSKSSMKVYTRRK